MENNKIKYNEHLEMKLRTVCSFYKSNTLDLFYLKLYYNREVVGTAPSEA